jgi:hypothetical protein
MKQRDLANEFRDRQEVYGMVDRETLGKISDARIIDSYITCSSCGNKKVKDKNYLNNIIEKSNNADEFLKMCDDFEEAHCNLID